MFRSSTARSRRSRTLLGAALGAALLLGAATPALADEYGTGGSGVGLLPDDAAHDYCFKPGFGGFYGEVAIAAMNNLDGQTNMSVSATSCGANTDVLFVLNYNLGSRASAQCTKRVSPTSTSQCNQKLISINPDRIRAQVPWWAPAGSFEFNVFKSLCHEVGHSVGLKDGTDQTDCMYSGDVSGANFSQYTTYNTHHVVDHINTRTVAWS